MNIKQNDLILLGDLTALRSTSQTHSAALLLNWTVATMTEDKLTFFFFLLFQIGVSEDRDKAELSSAVREELSDWQLSSLRSAEDDVAALDPAISETLNRSEITHLFLKHDVPLKLPTFSLLLEMFSDKNDPVQVR